MAMSKVDKEKLRCNRVKIIEVLQVDETLLSYLMQHNILTADMKETVEVEKTRSAKAQKLLDTLVRRGQFAFKRFIEALCETKQEDLAELLDSFQYKIYAKPPQELTVEEILTELDKREFVVKVNSMSQHLKQKLMSDRYGVYALNDGRAVILVTHSSNQDEGTKEDVKNLTSLFEKLHFKTDCFYALTAQDINATLEKERQTLKANTDAFILCILSCGGKDSEILGIDGRSIKIESILSCFDGINCPQLHEKPKLYFIHTGKQDPSVSEKALDFPEAESAIPGLDDVDSSQRPEKNKIHATHEKSDVFLTLSTTDVWNCDSKSSWFVRCLTYVISENAGTQNLEEMITKVIEIVKYVKINSSSPNKHILQLPAKSGTLRKTFYFMP